MKARFPGFKKCLAMMKSRDPQTQEDGFHWLRRHAGEHVPELIEAFGNEQDHGLRCWLLELLGESRSPAAFDLFAAQLRGEDERLRDWAVQGLQQLDTKEARTLLWNMREGDG